MLSLRRYTGASKVQHSRLVLSFWHILRILRFWRFWRFLRFWRYLPLAFRPMPLPHFRCISVHQRRHSACP